MRLQGCTFGINYLTSHLMVMIREILIWTLPITFGHFCTLFLAAGGVVSKRHGVYKPSVGRRPLSFRKSGSHGAQRLLSWPEWDGSQPRDHSPTRFCQGSWCPGPHTPRPVVVGHFCASVQKSRKCTTFEPRFRSDRAESAKTVRWRLLFDGDDGRCEVAILPLPPHFEIKFKFWIPKPLNY